MNRRRFTSSRRAVLMAMLGLALMGRGHLDLAQRWGQALDQVTAGLNRLTPRSGEDELLAVAQTMKAATVLFQNEVATALDVPLGFSDADGD